MSVRTKAAPATAKRKAAKSVKRGPRRKLSDAEIAEVFRQFALTRPDPKGELEHVNTFTLLVAVVLSVGLIQGGNGIELIPGIPEPMTFATFGALALIGGYTARRKLKAAAVAQA